MSTIKKTNKKKILVLGNGFLSQSLLNHFNKKKNFQIVCVLKKQNKNIKKISNVRYINISNQKEIKSIKKINIIINALGNIDHNKFNTISDIKMFKQHFYIPKKVLDLVEKNTKTLFIQIGSIDEINQIKKDKYFTTPYALYKYYFSKYLLTLDANNVINSKIVYVNSVFGNHQKKNRFIPSVIHNYIKNKKFHSNFPKTKRNFISSSEFASSIEKIINKPSNFKNNIIIKSNYDYKIEDIVKYIYIKNKNKYKINKYISKNILKNNFDNLIVKGNSSFESNIINTIDFYINE